MEPTIKFAALVVAVFLTGCSQTPGKGSLAVVGPLPNAGIVNLTSAHQSVAVTDAPPNGATILGQVTGASCKNSLLDPSATNEKALAQLREKAAAMGASGVFAVAYAPDPLPVSKNCWSMINATATAYVATAP